MPNTALETVDFLESLPTLAVVWVVPGAHDM